MAADDLFQNPPKPTGLVPGVDPAAVENVDMDQATPEEERQYVQIVKKAAQAIYADPKATADTLNDPRVPIHQAVGQRTAQLVMQIEKSAEDAGVKLSPDAMFQAGQDIVGMLLDLGIKAKILPLDPNSDQYQKIAGMALMEAEKVFGERVLADPVKGPQMTEQAGDMWARGIAEEVANGTASKDYLSMVNEQQANATPIGRAVRAGLMPGGK